MTGNKCYLTDYEDYDGSFVSFGDGKGRISGKGKIKTGTLDFDNVYFYKELKYNLFSVSQICDKKNIVLFIDTECLVLSSDFKLLDESQVLLRVPRKDNIYSVDLKSVVPTKVSKAIRVFNKRTRIVEETLNIRFLENTPNTTGIRPDWLFDVDSLTISMNYVPVVAGKQINGIVGTRDNIVTGQAEKKTEPEQEFILIPFCITDLLISQGPKDSKEDSGMKPIESVYPNNTNSINIISTLVSAAGPSFTNDDPSSPVNAAEASNAFKEHLFEIFSPFKNVFTLPPVSNVTLMDDTRIFYNAYDDEDVGAEADLNNFETTMNVSPIPTTRIDKNHPKDQVIGDFNSAIQTRRMTKIFDEHAMIEAMQSMELLQFQLQKVWTLVNLPNGKRAIGTKWVFRNKKDERGIVVRNKARLVAQGYTQEEGIDYDEMDVKSAFLYEKALYGLHQAPKAWYETLSTYLIENGFRRCTIDKTLFINKDKGDILLVQVYVDDIIFGFTKKSLCDKFEGLMHKRFQISSIRELTFFLGLQVQQKEDGIFISQDKYVAEILKKVDFATVGTTSTPMEPNKALVKDEEVDSVDVHLYRSMIGSLITPVSAAGPSFTNDDPSSPVNAAEASNAFEEHLFERFSPFKNAFTLPPVSNVTPMDDTGIFSNAYDDEDVGAKDDLNNLETTMNVSPIPITRIDKDHPKDLIIRDFNSAIQTRRMTKIFDEHAMVFRNKKDERGIVSDNQARLVAHGYTQDKTDYDSFKDPQFPNKVYKVEKALYGLHQAPRAWYETLSIYLIENGFRRGTIDKTLFIKKDKEIPDEFYGGTYFLLRIASTTEGGWIFISQDKYVDEILKNFDFATVKTASTPMEPNKALVKDEEVDSVDVHLYRLMIGSLMYLTASSLDIMFAVCACARFQVTPKTSHLHAVKMIFRYLKGQPKLGLWYPRDSPFDLEAFFDSDYARANLDGKSTIGGCQFLGKRLISWQCKKQTIVANSTTKAEYVAAANCCGQKPIIVPSSYQPKKTHKPRKAIRTTEISQSSRPINLVADETVYKEWEDRMERAATTASS
ncbi:putative ribonuclease H-like domain-containing protein [Tanacetum coccineum]